MRMRLPFPSPASLFPSSVVPRPTYNEGVDRALNLLLYPSNLASPGRLVKIARSLSPLFSRTHVVGIDQGELPADEAVAFFAACPPIAEGPNGYVRPIPLAFRDTA